MTITTEIQNPDATRPFARPMVVVQAFIRTAIERRNQRLADAAIEQLSARQKADLGLELGEPVRTTSR